MLQNPENVPLPTYDELAPEEHVPVNNANNEGLYDLFYNRNIDTSSSIVDKHDNYITPECCKSTFHLNCLEKWGVK